MQDRGKDSFARRRNRARWTLGLSTILFLVYFGNVLIGKLTVLGHVRPGWGMSDVGEFLFLLAATACFVAGTLLLERLRDDSAQS